MRYGIVAAVVIVLAAGAYFALRNPEGTPAGAKAFALEVRDRAVVGGPAQFTARQGDSVTITITANESDELHVHGYDKSVDFASGTPATLTFTANQSGRFPFEMEGSKTELGELDVLP